MCLASQLLFFLKIFPKILTFVVCRVLNVNPSDNVRDLMKIQKPAYSVKVFRGKFMKFQETALIRKCRFYFIFIELRLVVNKLMISFPYQKMGPKIYRTNIHALSVG